MYLGEVGGLDPPSPPLDPPLRMLPGPGFTKRWEPVQFDQLPVKPVRPGFGLGRYETGPNSKFNFEFKKMKKSQKNLKILQGTTNLMVSNFLKNSFI